MLGWLVTSVGIGAWKVSVSINDSALTSSATALTRAAGENVASSPYAIQTGSFTTPTTNYSAPTLVAGATLAITPAPLTATVANQTKVYGQDDPALAGVGVTLGGLINNAGLVTWNGTVSINDSALKIGRASCRERVEMSVGGSPYAIQTGSFTTPTTNYSAPTLVEGGMRASHVAGVQACVLQKTKVYGQDDPALAGVGVTLGGLINNAGLVTWNGTVSINDSAL